MSIFATMRKTLADVLANIDKLEAETKALDARREALEKLPMVNASPSWHLEKYLYVICRTRGGRRRREYIGIDAKKVEEAMARMSRYKEHERISDELQRLKNQATGAQSLLQQLENKLSVRGR